MINRTVEIINRFLRDKGIELPVTRGDLLPYMEPELTDDQQALATKFNCSQRTIYYYELFKYAFDSELTEAPHLSNIRAASMNKFKSLLGDVKISKLKQVNGEEVVIAARRYVTTLLDSTFFYSEILDMETFWDRMGAWMDNGSIWRKYLEEKQKANLMPYRLKNLGFIDERNISQLTKAKLLKTMTSNLVSMSVKNENDRNSPTLSDEDYEKCVERAYVRTKIWSNKSHRYPSGGTFKINYT